MGKLFTKGRIALIIIFSVLLIDQIIKILVKTNMYWHESIRITDWFYILFTENNGMAFGMEIVGKLFLTSFRIVAVIIIAYYLYKAVKIKMKTGFIVCISLILAGALGNIIDCVFYGVFFNESTHAQIASFLPGGGGYAPWFYGKVVDMFYFPLFTFPDWIPFLGGEIFFSPIFNLADSYITVAIFLLIIFYHKDFNSTIERYTSRAKK